MAEQLTFTEETETQAAAPPVEPEPEPEKSDPPTALEAHEAELDSLEPNLSTVVWEFGEGDMKLVLEQKPMSYFAKLEFFALLARHIDDAMSGENGMSLTAILSQIGVDRNSRSLSLASVDLDTFLQALVKVVENVSDFMLDSYCIWLGVRRSERALVKPILEAEVTDEQGLMIVQTFLDQNMEAIESFFTDRLPKLASRARKLTRRTK